MSDIPHYLRRDHRARVERELRRLAFPDLLMLVLSLVLLVLAVLYALDVVFGIHVIPRAKAEGTINYQEVHTEAALTLWIEQNPDVVVTR